MLIPFSIKYKDRRLWNGPRYSDLLSFVASKFSKFHPQKWPDLPIIIKYRDVSFLFLLTFLFWVSRCIFYKKCILSLKIIFNSLKTHLFYNFPLSGKKIFETFLRPFNFQKIYISIDFSRKNKSNETIFILNRCFHESGS